MQKAMSAASSLNQATEKVLRTEIRARMKGEEKLSLEAKAVGEAAATATMKVQDSLTSHVSATASQIKALTEELGTHKGHIEAELAISSGRVEAVSNQHASSLASLHKDHQILTKATRAAVNTLKERFATQLADLEARRIAACEAMHAELTQSIEDHAAECHQRISEVEETIVGKLDDTIQALAEERSERIAAVEAQRISFEAKLADLAAELRAADAAANVRIDESFARMDATDANLAGLATELRSADERIEGKLDEVAADLKAQLDGHTDELDNLAMQLEAQEDGLLAERSARAEAVRSCAEAAADALAAAAEEAHNETASVASDLVRVDEAQKAALNDLRFKIDHNFKAIEQTLDDYQVHTRPPHLFLLLSLVSSCRVSPPSPPSLSPSLPSSRLPGARGRAAALAREQLGAPAAARPRRARR